MIPRTVAAVPSLRQRTDDPGAAAWQRSLAGAVSSVGELLALLDLDPPRLAVEVASDFPLRVPRSFVARMRPGDPDDPLLRQVLPLAAERRPAPGFGHDPLAEADSSPLPGLLHKYRGRALLLTTGACAVHCRYCFRRHFPYGEHAGREGWGAALDYLAADPSLEEVILSGGDPLALADSRLAPLAAALDAIPHLRRLRLHTRLPVVLPERVDRALLAWLGDTRLRTVVVIHANHRREIDGAVRRALARLAAVGASLLNQSVLLAGVNDRVAALRELSEVLFDAGVLPYYLHLMDRVRGAAHFEVDEARARRLLRRLRRELPGYLVPRLVREVPGRGAKVPLSEPTPPG